MSNPSITADKTPWYQWDTGLTVTVAAKMTECHFANRKQGSAYVQAVINGVARVPDELLQVAAPIKAYGYISDGAGGQTYIEQSFEVIARNIPADYTYTKTAQKTIRDAEVARDEAVQAAKDAKTSALDADDSAIEASKSAQSAGDSASAAATSARTAAKSAGEAATSASEAKAAADKAVEDASELLKIYTDKAKTSADNAATSASNAADAASAASGSASAAEQSASDASNAKAAAQTAKGEAEKAKDAAATSASNAESSATAAAKSASDAAASVGAINVIAPKSVGTAAVSSESSVAFGSGAATNANNSVAVGRRSMIAQNADNSVAVGQDAVARAVASVCVGVNSKTMHVNSIAIGANSVTSKSREMSIGKPAEDSAVEFTREITHVSTPSADTSASTKKYADDNDAKTLTEAKKYTDDNTTNALISKVSGKLLHVEDAWPSPLLNVTIDGAYKQDGTPSPDAPAPVVVIENPVLHVTGKNLVQSYLVDNATSQYSVVLSAFAGLCESQHFQVSFNSDSIGNKLYFNENIFNYLQVTVKQTNSFDITTLNSISKSNTSQYYKTRGWLLLKNDAGNQQPLTVSDFQIAYGGTATGYAPYNGRSVSITLPAEHPYLAALPDGTRDEIVIDKDGNASLVARTQKVVILTTNTVFGAGAESSAAYISCAVNVLSMAKSAIVSSNYVASGYTSKSGYVYLPNNNTVVYRDDRFTSKEQALELLANETTYVSIKPKTYPLGKLTIPSLPETISNVWTDAELITNMSMTYKRDVNVIIANLNAQIAALKGTADPGQDDSTTTPDDAIDAPYNSEALEVTDTTIE